MSKGIVQRLRDERYQHSIMTDVLMHEAADLIEALEAEVERWRNNSDNADVQIADLKAEVARLREALKKLASFEYSSAEKIAIAREVLVKTS